VTQLVFLELTTLIVVGKDAVDDDIFESFADEVTGLGMVLVVDCDDVDGDVEVEVEEVEAEDLEEGGMRVVVVEVSE